MQHEHPSARRAKSRLVAEIARAERLAASGERDKAEGILQSLATDPDAAALGSDTLIGLPRKLHSAWLRMAKANEDTVRILGLRATAVPRDEVFGDLFRASPDLRAALVAAASWPVPTTIHQIWIGGPPPASCRVWADYAARHGWGYRLWDEAGLAALGVSADPLWRAMVQAGDLPGAVDVARYHLLIREGGLYLDCDWYPARQDLPPDAVLPGHGLSVIAEPHPRLVVGASLLLSNALIAAPVRHPALLHLLAALPDFAGRLPGAPAWWVTGPLAFTAALRNGPVTVLDAHLIAGSLPRGAPPGQAEAFADRCRAGNEAGFLVAWKDW